MKKVGLLLSTAVAALVLVMPSTWAAERIQLPPDTPDREIVNMQPKDIDPSLLPLDSTEDLHTTGRPQQVDTAVWRLEVTGTRGKNPASFSYKELSQMEMIKKKVILICPGFFVDYAEWEGIPLSVLLDRAGAEQSHDSIVFRALDGYSSRFTREEVEDNLLFLALKVNGEVLPKEHGFPVRLVAENILGGRWVKWISSIEVE